MRLQGVALLRNGDLKAAGRSLEAADLRLGIIEQHELDLLSQKEHQNQSKINRTSSHQASRSGLGTVIGDRSSDTGSRQQRQARLSPTS